MGGDARASAAAGAVVVVASLLVAACGAAEPDRPASTATGSAGPPSALALCREAAGRVEHARVDVAVPVTVADIKAWVTAPMSDGSRIDWSEFSASLAAAGPDDPAAVCAVSMTQGLYTPPAGVGTPDPVEAFICFAQTGGRRSGYEFGSRSGMIADVKARFPAAEVASG